MDLRRPHIKNFINLPFSTRKLSTPSNTVERRELWRRSTHSQPQQGLYHRDTPRLPTRRTPEARRTARGSSSTIPIVHATRTWPSTVAAPTTLVLSCRKPTYRRGGGAKVSTIRVGKGPRCRESGGWQESRRGIAR